MENNVNGMVVIMSEPVIKKVEMLEGGTGGLRITYRQTETIGGVCSGEEYTLNKKKPVHRELRSLFDQLKEHFLRTSAYHWGSTEAMELLKTKCSVKSVMSNGQGNAVKESVSQFQLGGIMNTTSEYKFSFNGPLYTTTDYSQYFGDGKEMGLADIIEKIWEETKLFKAGYRKADNKLVAVDYLRNKKDVANADDEFDKMSSEEQYELIKDAMESYGLEIIEENGESVVSVIEEKEEVVVKKEKVFKKEKEAVSVKVESKDVKAKAADVGDKNTAVVASEVPQNNQELDEDADWEIPVFTGKK